MRPLTGMLKLIALAGGILLAAEVEGARARARLAAVSGRATQGGSDARELLPGAPVERDLAAGESHAYHLGLTAGQYLRVVVERRGILVSLTLSGPDGQQILEVGRNHALRPEAISALAEASGVYRLAVSAPKQEAPRGGYLMSIAELRAATPVDRHRAAAELALAEGDRWRKRGTAESLRQAVAKYEEALPQWRAAEDRAGEALTLDFIGLVHRSLGGPQKALDYYHQALSLRRTVGDSLGESETLNNLGSAHFALGNLRTALDFFHQALPLQRQLSDRQGEAATLNNLGSVYWAFGEPQAALDHYRQALPLRRALNDRRGEAVTLNNLGTVYANVDEPQKALESYRQALPLRRAVGDGRGEATTLHNIGTLYGETGELPPALDYFERALAIRRAVGDRQGEAQTLGAIGWTRAALGERQQAVSYYEQALALFRAAGNRRGEAQTLSKLGVACGELGDAHQAQRHAGQALALYREVGDRRGEAQALDTLGESFASRREWPQALEHYRQALDLRRVIGDRAGEAHSLLGLARVESARGNLDEACAQLRAALEIVESSRAKLPGLEWRASFLAAHQDLYTLHIDLLLRLHERQPARGYDGAALEVSERARARSLLETLVEARADLRQGVDPAWLERERALQEQLHAKEEYRLRLLSGQHTAEQAAAARAELDDLRAAYQEARARTRAANPRYAALTQSAPLGLQEIQRQVLDADTLLLEYSLGAERSFLWAVTPTSVSVHELPNRAEIEAAARRAYQLLTTSRQRAVRLEAGRAAAALSRMVLAPAAELLRASAGKRLLIVSDGALQYVPFGALPAPGIPQPAGPGQAGLRAADLGLPLIARHEIVSLPSASALAVLRRELAGRAPAAQTAAVFSDPVFRGDDLRVKTAPRAAAPSGGGAPGPALELARSAEESGLTGFERLRFSRQEAEAIVSLARAGRSFKALDFDASRATVERMALDQYRIIHFATHGLLNSKHPELSGIVLSLVDERGEPQDGFLRAHQIYNLKLNADLVVLSACRTALGKEVKGEGLVGLTRGFMYAGAARVVASLWDVKDEATAELMKRFYRGMLQDGLRPAAALRAAQVSMSREPRWAAPYYWAGFVLQGEWR